MLVKRKCWTLILLVCMVLVSCGGFVMTEQDSKPQITAAPDKATLVIYRGTVFGAAVVINNFVDTEFVGQTKGRSYFLAKVDPGAHYVIGASENKACAKFDFEAGKVYYLLQGIYPGLMKARTGFSGVTPQDFEKDVEDMDYFVIESGVETPTIDEEDYKETVADHEKELKEDPDKHKDTANLQGY